MNYVVKILLKNMFAEILLPLFCMHTAYFHWRRMMPHSWPGLTRKEKGKLNKGDAGSSLESVQMFPRFWVPRLWVPRAQGCVLFK